MTLPGHKFSTILSALSGILLLLGSHRTARAASYTWDPGHTGNSGGTGNWNVSDPSWYDGTVNLPWTNGVNTAVFGGAAGTVTTTSAIQVNAMTFNQPGYNVANGTGGSVTLVGSNPTIGGTASATVSAGLSGNVGLFINNSGTITLSGSNTYTGATTIGGGTVAIANGASIGGNTSFDNGVVLNNGGTLLATANVSIDRSLAFHDNYIASPDQATVTLAAVPGATLAFQARSLTQYQSTSIVFGSAVNTGTVALSLVGSFGTQGGVQNLTVAGGTLRAGNDVGLTPLTSFNFSTTVAAGATLDFNGYDGVDRGITPALRNLQGAGRVLTGGTAATNITVGQGNFSGTIAGPGQITKVTNSTLTLSGTSTYSGGTLVSEGELVAAANGALGTGNVSIASSAVRLTLGLGVTDAIANTARLTIAGGGNAGVADAGFLQLNGNFETVGSLVLGGTLYTSGTFTSAAFPEYLAGAGAIIVSAVPEPATWSLLVLGSAGIAAARSRKRAST